MTPKQALAKLKHDKIYSKEVIDAIEREIKKPKELSKRSNPIDEFIKSTIEDYLVMNGVKVSKEKFELLCNQQIAQVSNILLNVHEYIWNDIKRRTQNETNRN